jgi:hypothetical protein
MVGACVGGVARQMESVQSLGARWLSENAGAPVGELQAREGRELRLA